MLLKLPTSSLSPSSSDRSRRTVSSYIPLRKSFTTDLELSRWLSSPSWLQHEPCHQPKVGFSLAFLSNPRFLLRSGPVLILRFTHFFVLSSVFCQKAPINAERESLEGNVEDGDSFLPFSSSSAKASSSLIANLKFISLPLSVNGLVQAQDPANDPNLCEFIFRRDRIDKPGISRVFFSFLRSSVFDPIDKTQVVKGARPNVSCSFLVSLEDRNAASF